MAWAWVIIGSALGGMARYGISGAVARRIGETFPWGTLAVNVSGSFVIGVFAALVMPGHALAGERMAGAFVMTGLCGGYTTFSSFSLETLNLARDGAWPRVLANIVASAALCLLAVEAGFALGAFTPGG
jgi:fluoride exporter